MPTFFYWKATVKILIRSLKMGTIMVHMADIRIQWQPIRDRIMMFLSILPQWWMYLHLYHHRLPIIKCPNNLRISNQHNHKSNTCKITCIMSNLLPKIISIVIHRLVKINLCGPFRPIVPIYIQTYRNICLWFIF